MVCMVMSRFLGFHIQNSFSGIPKPHQSASSRVWDPTTPGGYMKGRRAVVASFVPQAPIDSTQHHRDLYTPGARPSRPTFQRYGGQYPIGESPETFKAAASRRATRQQLQLPRSGIRKRAPLRCHSSSAAGLRCLPDFVYPPGDRRSESPSPSGSLACVG